MSEERTKLLQRFEERLARLEAGVHDGVVHWKKFHLHKALEALPDDHSIANLHLDEFDRDTDAGCLHALVVGQHECHCGRRACDASGRKD